jgi:hypothetical protein
MQVRRTGRSRGRRTNGSYGEDVFKAREELADVV